MLAFVPGVEGARAARRAKKNRDRARVPGGSLSDGVSDGHGEADACSHLRRQRPAARVPRHFERGLVKRRRPGTADDPGRHDMAAAANREREPNRPLFAPGPRRFRIMFAPSSRPPPRSCAKRRPPPRLPPARMPACAAAAARGGALVRGAGGSWVLFHDRFRHFLHDFLRLRFRLWRRHQDDVWLGNGRQLRNRDLRLLRPPRAPPLSFAVRA